MASIGDAGFIDANLALSLVIYIYFTIINCISTHYIKFYRPLKDEVMAQAIKGATMFVIFFRVEIFSSRNLKDEARAPLIAWALISSFRFLELDISTLKKMNFGTF